MVKRRRSGILKRVKYQRGSTSIKEDRKLRAMPPGKRSGKKGDYWETRKNRSDLRGGV